MTEVPRDLAARFDVVETEVTLGAARFVVLRPRDAEALISEADFARDERLPYWADVWPSAIILAAKLLEQDGNGRSALELGCGAGLCTIAAASAGFDVLATDYYEDALEFTVFSTTTAVQWFDLCRANGAAMTAPR